MTAFARATFPVLLPFPQLRMGWGLDVHWAALAREHGWRCGVVDAVAIRHRAAPAASAYPRAAAMDEAREFLASRPYLSARGGRSDPDDPPNLVSTEPPSGPKVAVVAEFYPSRRDPVLGIWAHRQALAARDAGAEVHVLVLHRLVPPRSSLSAGAQGAVGATLARAREPRRQTRDGIPVTYVPYVSPPRDRSYADWGAWSARPLALALRRLASSFPFELVHAHNAVPAGDAARRGPPPGTPLVVSVHGGDVLYTARRDEAGAQAVAAGLGAARLVLANSRGIAELARAAGAGETRVVHLGTDMPAATGRRLAPRRPAVARDGRASRRPQAPRRRAPRAGGACARATRPCATRSSATGPSGPRWKASPRAWASPSASTSSASSRPSRRSPRPSAAPCS